MPPQKDSDHDYIPEPRNRIRCLRIVDWEKLPLKSKFSKTVGTIEINVQRSWGLPIFIQIDSIILVFFVSWRSAFLKIGNHWINLNLKYIWENQNLYYIVLKEFMVPDSQKSWSSRDEKHWNNGINLNENWQAAAPLNVDFDGTNSFWKFWF